MTQPSSARRLRFRQFLMTAALVTPLMVAIASAPPFAAETKAQGPSRMVGPLFPITAGSDNIVPIRSGLRVLYPTRWACGDTEAHTVTLANPDGSGRYRTIMRELGSLHQDLTITNFVGSSPQQFVLTETRGGVVVHTTTANLVDLNSDGVFDTINFSGQYNVTISLVFNGDNVSIPWSEANSIGIDTNYACAGAGALPQVWIPLADTNGDGRGDAVVLDLDGNGVADSDIYAGPVVAAPSVPTMGPIARLLLLIMIGLTGSWFLSRHRHDPTGTPA